MIKLPCAGGHTFHKDCIIQWINQNNTCPICKTEITEEILNSLEEDKEIDKDSDNNYGAIPRNEPQDTRPPLDRGRTSWMDTHTVPQEDTNPIESRSNDT